MDPFDVSLYHAINGLAGHSTLLDDIMKFFAKDALEIYAVMFIMGWFAIARNNIKSRHALVMSGLAGILALCINVVIAHIWFRPRPFTVLPHGSFTQLIPHSPDASFPSDHASGSWAFAAGTYGKAPKLAQWTFTAVALIVMFARVYVGVHWPTDVLGSVVVGVFSGRVIWLLSPVVYPITAYVAKLFRFGPKQEQIGATSSAE